MGGVVPGAAGQAVVLGVLCGCAVPPAGPPRAAAHVTVVRAARDLPSGTTIATDHLARHELPEGWLPDEAYRSAEELVGRRVAERILAGELVREERLADPDDGLQQALAWGRARLLRLPVRADQAAALQTTPALVDVLAACTGPTGVQVATLAQRIPVVTPAWVPPDAPVHDLRTDEATPSLPVVATPSVAERLVHAARTCTLGLAVVGDLEAHGLRTNPPRATPTCPVDPDVH